MRERLQVLGLGLLLLLGGCASPVEVSPGPYARDPVCAEILQATPEELHGAERRSTSAQASTAWGTPPATLRCGVTPPGPTTDRCVSVETGEGQAVDWISVAEAEPQEDGGAWTFVTYGRVPAVEVVVPVALVGEGQATAYLGELGSAIARVPAERECLGLEDAAALEEDTATPEED